MSQLWTSANEERLTAEILRDFCALSITLQEQFTRFDHAGNLSYAVLREIVGDMMDKGLLWRLKDTTHHILRDAPSSVHDTRLLDWAVGYIFHETLKLMEDTHQRQYYTPRLQALAEDSPMPDSDPITREFIEMAVDTQTDMARGVYRIRRLLANARHFFQRSFAGKAHNRHVARLLNDREDLVRAAFADAYDDLVRAIYGDTPERLHIEAAISLRAGGRMASAEAALAKARAMSPNSPLLEAFSETPPPGESAQPL